MSLLVVDKLKDEASRVPDSDNPGQFSGPWVVKPWAPNDSDLLPKALGMTNFS
jgi:hypothetical protein